MYYSVFFFFFLWRRLVQKEDCVSKLKIKALLGQLRPEELEIEGRIIIEWLVVKDGGRQRTHQQTKPFPRAAKVVTEMLWISESAQKLAERIMLYQFQLDRRDGHILDREINARMLRKSPCMNFVFSWHPNKEVLSKPLSGYTKLLVIQFYVQWFWFLLHLSISSLTFFRTAFHSFPLSLWFQISVSFSFQGIVTPPPPFNYYRLQLIFR